MVAKIIFFVINNFQKKIPALLWWQLVTKKMEYDIQNDTKNRKREGNKVRFTLSNVSV
jgi:phosphomevalonate kinase